MEVGKKHGNKEENDGKSTENGPEIGNRGSDKINKAKLGSSSKITRLKSAV